MSREVEVIVANPAGNITIMVLTPTPRDEYQTVANKLLEIDFAKLGVSFASRLIDDSPEIKGEQVAFILPDDDEGYPRMEMCGLEFCGNASRSFAYYKAVTAGNNLRELDVRVSGCDYPLHAVINPLNHDAEIQMPLPVRYFTLSSPELGLDGEERDIMLVDMDGISHLVTVGVPASIETFNRIKKYLYEHKGMDMEAFGIMFMSNDKLSITPVVYVRDVDTTYFEGSCASGTTGASCALVYDHPDGVYEFSFEQPKGLLHTTVTRRGGETKEVKLSGLLELSKVVRVTI